MYKPHLHFDLNCRFQQEENVNPKNCYFVAKINSCSNSLTDEMFFSQLKINFNLKRAFHKTISVTANDTFIKHSFSPTGLRNDFKRSFLFLSFRVEVRMEKYWATLTPQDSKGTKFNRRWLSTQEINRKELHVQDCSS